MGKGSNGMTEFWSAVLLLVLIGGVGVAVCALLEGRERRPWKTVTRFNQATFDLCERSRCQECFFWDGGCRREYPTKEQYKKVMAERRRGSMR